MKKSLVIATAVALWSCMPAQVKQERAVGPFSSIKVGSAIKVVLTISDKESLTFEAEESVIGKLKAEVKDGELHLYTENRTETKKDMIAYVSAKQIRALDVSGAADVSLTTPLKGEKLHLETSGAGEVTLDLEVKELDAEINGAADVEIKGNADELIMDISGAADFRGSKLVADNAKLKVSGASKAAVNVTGNLKVNATGASKVIYSGTPTNKDIMTSGAASVKAG